MRTPRQSKGVSWNDERHTRGTAFDGRGHCIDFRIERDNKGRTCAIYASDIAFLWPERTKSIDSDADHE